MKNLTGEQLMLKLKQLDCRKGKLTPVLWLITLSICPLIDENWILKGPGPTSIVSFSKTAWVEVYAFGVVTVFTRRKMDNQKLS